MGGRAEADCGEAVEVPEPELDGGLLLPGAITIPS